MNLLQNRFFLRFLVRLLRDLRQNLRLVQVSCQKMIYLSYICKLSIFIIKTRFMLVCPVCIKVIGE